MSVAALLIGRITGNHSRRGGLVLDKPLVRAGSVTESGRLEHPTGLGLCRRGALRSAVGRLSQGWEIQPQKSPYSNQ